MSFKPLIIDTGALKQLPSGQALDVGGWTLPTAGGTENYVLIANVSGNAVWNTIDHGDLSGLADDDHPQYLRKTGWNLNYSSEVTLAFVNGTRTFSITPTGANFTYWVSGVQYTKTTQQSVTITDTEGLWFIYFDGANLVATQTLWSFFDDDKSWVAYVYWDADNNSGVVVGYELHSWLMDSGTHGSLHTTQGSSYATGFALGDMDVDGNGNDASAARLSVGNGLFYDEDINNNITDGSPQELSPISELPVFWRTGASGYWRKETATTYPCHLHASGNRLAFNEWTGVTWQQTEVGSNNDFTLSHIFATNNILEPVIVVMGQNEYATRNQARQGATTEMLELALGALIGVFQEFVPIATVIFKTNSNWTNAVHARVQSTDEGDDYIDWRDTTGSKSAISGITAHAELSGLTSGDDHTQYVLYTGATTSVDLGSQTLTTTSTVTGSNIPSPTVDDQVLISTASGVAGWQTAGNDQYLASNGSGVVAWADNLASMVNPTADDQVLISTAAGAASWQTAGNDQVLASDGSGEVAWTDKSFGDSIPANSAANQIYVGTGVGTADWTTDLAGLTSLTVDNITINGASITSSTGTISFSNENLTTTGTLTSGQILATHNAYPVGRFTRTTAVTSSAAVAANALTQTSGNMVDGFGTGLVFSVEDATSGIVNIAGLYAVRANGVDNSGNLEFYTSNAGSLATRGRFTHDGNFVVDSGSITADSLTDGTANLTGGSLTGVKLGSLTTNGFVKTSGSDGTLSVDTSTYLTAESDTLDTVADRGATTDKTLTAGGFTTTGTITAGLLTVDNISIDGAIITSDTGAISFSDENLTTTGTVVGTNIPSPTVDNQTLISTASGIAGWQTAGNDQVLASDGSGEVAWTDKSFGDSIPANSAANQIYVGTGVGTADWTTDLAGLTSLTVDNITINGASITSSTGTISFSNENLTTTGTLTSGQILATHNAYPVGRFTRTTAVTSSAAVAANALTQTSGNMVDGFGTGLVFSVEDATSGIVNIAGLYAVRANGVDNSGNLEFYTSNAGSLATRGRFTHDGNFVVDSGSITADSLTIDNITIDGAVISSNTGAISFSNENLTTTGTVVGTNIPSPTVDNQALSSTASGVANWNVTALADVLAQEVPAASGAERKFVLTATSASQFEIESAPWTIALTTDETVYVRTTGNDTIGNGSIGSPFLTLERTIRYIGGLYIGDYFVTVDIGEGVFSEAGTLTFQHPFGSQVIWRGVSEQITSQNTNSISASGTSLGHSNLYRYDVTFILPVGKSVSVGDYIAVREVSGGTLPQALYGCHYVSGWVGGSRTATVQVVYRNGAPKASGTVTCTIELIKTVIAFPNKSGLKVSGPYHAGLWEGLVIQGDYDTSNTNAKYGVWLLNTPVIALSGSSATGKALGIVGFQTGIYTQNNAMAFADYAFISKCGTRCCNAQNGGILSVRWARLSGANNNGIFAFNGSTVAAQGVQIVAVGNDSILSYQGSFIDATSSYVDQNNATNAFAADRWASCDATGATYSDALNPVSNPGNDGSYIIT